MVAYNCLVWHCKSSNPTATILPTVIISNYKPAPVVGYFSSRGPTIGLKNLLKVDDFGLVYVYIYDFDMELDDEFLMKSNNNIICPCHRTIYKYFMLVLDSIRNPLSDSISLYIYIYTQRSRYRLVLQ